MEYCKFSNLCERVRNEDKGKKKKRKKWKKRELAQEKDGNLEIIIIEF